MSKPAKTVINPKFARYTLLSTSASTVGRMLVGNVTTKKNKIPKPMTFFVREELKINLSPRRPSATTIVQQENIKISEYPPGTTP